MGYAQWVDLGIYLQSFMLLAVEKGLATCAQGFWRMYNDMLIEQLALPDGYQIAFGIALGYEDVSAPINSGAQAVLPAMNGWCCRGWIERRIRRLRVRIVKQLQWCANCGKTSLYCVQLRGVRKAEMPVTVKTVQANPTNLIRFIPAEEERVPDAGPMDCRTTGTSANPESHGHSKPQAPRALGFCLFGQPGA
jgi:hypothetical protein